MLAEVGLGLHATYLSKMPLALLQVAQLKVFLVELVKRKEKKRKERPNDKKNKTKENDFISVFPNDFP